MALFSTGPFCSAGCQTTRLPASQPVSQSARLSVGPYPPRNRNPILRLAIAIQRPLSASILLRIADRLCLQ